ncbi:MAG: glycosyltransferase family 4 protein, partial [Anaerolineae bacterium]|nr:glycosyltransferase family 4 protein [Anaerolineae bacterium]
LRATIALYRHLQPDIVHHVTIKPVIYGGFAARIAGVPAVVGAMSGLGYVFIGEGRKSRLLRQVVKPLLRAALGTPNTRMIFQNPDDRERFVQMALLRREQTVVIRGSGVDTAQFSPQPESAGKPIVLFAGRLMRQKGIFEFLEAAKVLHDVARFVVVGYAEETSPDTVPAQQLQQWEAQGWIEYWGRRDDMPQVFAQSHIVCLPSTYGEGVPKVLIEGASCARALVTTDTPGCREICRHEETGLLVPPNDTPALIAAVRRLIDDAALRQQLGIAGRQLVLDAFSLALVTHETLSLYEALLANDS